MTSDEFYQEVEKLLSAEHAPERFIYQYRNRWNNRSPGRGRYPGCGLVRCFGNTVHVALVSPQLTGTYSSFDAALEAIARATVSDENA